MTSIVRHFKVQKDGSLKLVGNETVKIEEGKKKLTLFHTIDNMTMQKLGDIAYNGMINPDDLEV